MNHTAKKSRAQKEASALIEMALDVLDDADALTTLAREAVERRRPTPKKARAAA